MSATPAAAAESGLLRAIGLRALAANGVNQMVGAAIFVVPAAVAATLGAAAVLAYLVCALAAGLVALCFAEAGSRVSVTGGTYMYVETAFGPFAGFLAGSLFWFGGQVVANAGVAVVLVGSVGELLPWARAPLPRAALLIALYAVLTLVNVRGVRGGARLVEGLTLAKLAPLVLLVVAAPLAFHPANLRWTGVPSLHGLGSASILLVFAFLGIEGALTPSGEVRDPARTVPRAILLAFAGTTVLYIALQVAAQGVLGAGLAREQAAPLAAAAGLALGDWGRRIVLAGAAISCLGYLGGDLLASPRMLFAFARDGFLPAPLAAVHPRYRTPAAAIVAHAALACALAITGSFRALALLSVVATLFLYLACALATLELRRRDVRAEGTPLRLPLGPVIPVLAVLVVVWLLASASAAEFRAVGGFLAAAALLYLVRARRLRLREPVALPAD